MFTLYNSLTRQKEEFHSIKPDRVGLYTCGMTVYDYAHIGHGRKYTMDDVLRRTLTFLGYQVTHVQNVTDVGHLVSDADEGGDKMEKGALKAGKTVWEIAEFFTQHFYDSMDRLHILRPTVVCRATDHIQEQIDLIQRLIDNNVAYDTPEAVYFEVSKFLEYGQLFGQKLDEKEIAVREDVITGSYKRNPADFVLWAKRTGHHANHIMHWDSPWGDGFPGWHIECSAMSMKYLGETFDIHTGGEDHLSIHHPNEIAQSQAATGEPLAHYWIHHAFLMVDGQKMSKSLGNFYRVEDVIERGFNPISLRYLYLNSHYRKPLNFTWSGLEAAEKGLYSLLSWMQDVPAEEADEAYTQDSLIHRNNFIQSICDDLNTPKTLAAVWEMVRSDLPRGQKLKLMREFDEVLGFGLDDFRHIVIPEDVKELLDARNEARNSKDYSKSDQLRDQIDQLGYTILDTKEGSILRKKY
ncbi:cysteine--tRNA ligase [candidate division WWE3 bacterium]|nr:cysteine--tRNA ligase [candidate division WWE3 bacterium]